MFINLGQAFSLQWNTEAQIQKWHTCKSKRLVILTLRHSVNIVFYFFFTVHANLLKIKLFKVAYRQDLLKTNYSSANPSTKNRLKYYIYHSFKYTNIPMNLCYMQINFVFLLTSHANSILCIQFVQVFQDSNLHRFYISMISAY